MIVLIKMALRDLGRNRRRSLFSALALGIGVALLLMIAAFVQGEMRGSMESSVKLDSGHMQVRAKGYKLEKLSLAYEDLIQDPEALAAQIASLAPVKVATPRLFASGIVAVSDQTFGVRVIGIDPLSDANAPYRDGLVAGEFLTSDDRGGILIGQSLADKSNLKSGDSLQLLVNTANGEVDEQTFVIRGIYKTKIPTYDQATVFMPLAKAQAITQTENHASVIFIMLQDMDQVPQVVAALQTNQYEVLTFADMNKLFTDLEQYMSAFMILIYVIVLAITAAVIVNTLIMAVFERTREIGILSALGMKSSRIMAMFFAESFFLAVGGVAIGLVFGGIAVALLARYGFFIGDFGIQGFMIGERIYAYLTWNDALTLTITAFVITLLAAIYPAALAARMEPVDAMRGGKQA
jgi:ABC-type lipoprotein release transport system permease subunit